MTKSVASTFGGFRPFCRHPCEGRDRTSLFWSDPCPRRDDGLAAIPAFAGMTKSVVSTFGGFGSLPSSLRRQGSHFAFLERLLPSQEWRAWSDPCLRRNDEVGCFDFRWFRLFCRHPCEGRDRTSLFWSDSCLRRNGGLGAAPAFAGMTKSVASTFGGFRPFCRHPCEGRDRTSLFWSDPCLRRNDGLAAIPAFPEMATLEMTIV